jgi:hypothetical protein
MRTIAAGFLATTLVVTSAFAATQSVASLPAGKPAGVKEAASLGPNVFLLLLGSGIIIGGVALAVSGNNNNGVTTPSTTSTSSTGLP